MRGTFQSSGQNCIGIERVIAEPRSYAKLVDILEDRVKALRLGSGIDQLEEIDVGALISAGPKFDYLEETIAQAVKEGARLLVGGKRYAHPNYPQGHYFSPTLLVDVTPEMTIAKEEVFGPVLTLMKAENTDDAIAIANSTDYGLGASVFTGSFAAGNRITNQLKAGNVAINDFATFYVCQLPFGGVKSSGYGKFGGEEGLQGLCVAKSVCYDKLSFIQTRIPAPLDYPIKNGKKAWKFVSSLNRSGYDNSLWQRVKSILTLAKNAA
ncbi:unnamed protein product [Kuraishia capsulata CBS 1993]|uniref:Aldehyde dehydrogenase domain-containing protein n=1 Tax=Kuraishia capsulata CBS 1993 TaxID=1382522 RepID=W6MTA8_9ASCO|nr:uncharacterized protein KUCA_T00000952001 [Kuraishia capsulata CBS 1993]CDK24985.1 unnamed protein product [Kuraishia capsulata CBS 1993]